MNALRIPLVLGLLLGLCNQTLSQPATPAVTMATITRAVQISASVQSLSANQLTSVRDQAWLSFMTEYYLRNPNTPAVALTQAYASYSNAFNNFVATGRAAIALPTQSQLLNLVIQAASQIPSISNNAAYAASALQLASQAAQMAGPSVQSVVQSAGYAPAILQASLQQAANQFVAVPVQVQWNSAVSSALTLADQNPKFRNAYQSIMTPLTQIAPGDSLDQMLQKIPALQTDATLSTVLANVDATGVLQNPIPTILSLFNDQVNQVSSTVNTALGSITGVLQQETINLPDYLQATLLPDPGSFNVDLAQNADQVIQSASASFNFLSDLMSPLNEGFSEQIGEIGQLSTTVASAINSFDIGDLVGTVADFADGDILGGIMGAFSMFGGGGGPDPAEQELLQGQQEILQNEQLILQGETQILQGEGVIITNIQLMREDMDQQFANVDQELNQIYNAVETGFTEINSNMNVAFTAQSNQIAAVFGSLSYQLVNINATLIQQRNALNTFERNVYNDFQAEQQDDFKDDVAAYLGYQEENSGAPMGANTYQNQAALKFYEWATINSVDAIQAPPGSSVIDLAAAFNNSSDPATSLNCIAGFLTSTLGVTPILSSSAVAAIPNPHVWAMSANAYDQLALENMAPFQYYPADRLASIINAGGIIESTLANITYTNNTGINWPLWNAAFDFYREQVTQLATALETSEFAYETNISLNNPSLGASNIDLIHETHYVQFVAGNPSQTGNMDGSGTGASFQNFGALCPAANGGCRGIAYNGDGTYSIRRVSPSGNVVTEITIPASPMVDGNYTYMGTMSAGADNSLGSLNGPLYITSFFAAPDGTCYITMGNDSGNPDSIDQVPYLNTSQVICTVNTNGSLSSFAGQYEYFTYGDSDGPQWDAGFSEPRIVGANGSDLYVSDAGGFRVISNGYVTTLTNLSEVYNDFYSSMTAYGPGSYYDVFVAGPSLVFSGGDIFVPGSSVFYELNTNSGAWATNSAPNSGQVTLAPGGNNVLWIKQQDCGSLGLFQPTGSGSNQTLWTSSCDQFITDAVLGSADLGRLDGSAMCLDSYGDLYLMAGNGNELARIGTPWLLQPGLFTRWANDLSSSGAVVDLPVVTGLQNLDVAKTLILDLATFGLSQSLAQDDVLHSLLNGTNGLIDTPTAAALINSQLAALAGGPAQPVLDLPTLASNRLDALWSHVVSHLLDVQSHASVPTDGLVFDLLISGDGARDISLASNTVALFQTPHFTNWGVADPQSLVCSGAEGLAVTNEGDLVFDSNTDFTVGFWAWMPTQGDVYVGNVEGGAASAPGEPYSPSHNINAGSWWIDFNDGWTLTTALQPENGAAVNMAPYAATNFAANQNSDWFYITLVVTRAGGTVQCYVNGSPVAQGMIGADVGGFGEGNLFIGGDSPFGPALVNEVSVWRRALGPGEISNIYAAGAQGMNVLSYSTQAQRNPNPTESVALIDATMQNLQILEAMYGKAAPPSLLSVQKTASGLQLQALGEPGVNYTLQSSTNLRDWRNVQAYLPEAAIAPTNISSGSVFFRTMVAPTPE